MYIGKYWGNFIGGSDDSLNLVAFLEDQKKEEIPLSEIFAKIGLDKQNWDFHQTVEYLEFTHSNGVEIDFHFAIDVVTDLAAILLECSVSGGVNLHDLDEYNTPSRRIRVTATAEEHDAMDKALADFAQAPLSYDLHDLMSDEEIEEMAHQVAALRKELYESAGRNRSYHVKAEDMKNLLPDWAGADGCIATNRITVEGCKVGYCYREEPDGDWDSGWRFTAGDESDDYMDDPNNAGLYKLNTICNDDSDIIPLLNTPAPCAFERDEHGVFQPIKDWKPENEEEPDGDWDSGWRFTAGDESEAYMDDPNNAGIYKLNTICNDDPDIIPLLNTPAPCAFERDENGVFQQIKDWKPDEDEEGPDMDILKQ